MGSSYLEKKGFLLGLLGVKNKKIGWGVWG